MKLQPDKTDVQTITGHGPGWIGINKEPVAHSVVVGAAGERIDWECGRFEDLTPQHFARLAELDAEVVIFGSGLRNRFPPAAWLQPLIARRIGLETMDTAAACRTYNILAGEGRKVVAALLLETAAPAGTNPAL
ncbi:MAG: Mth938-like domain-containing protein [Xylophilus ampelinus]